MYNHVTLVGRLTADPEMRYSPNGAAVTTFRLAVDRGNKSQSGEKETDFFQVVCFKEQAEMVAQHITKGRTVLVDGRIHIRTVDGDDGKKRYFTDIVANPYGVRFLPDGKGKGTGDQTPTDDTW